MKNILTIFIFYILSVTYIIAQSTQFEVEGAIKIGDQTIASPAEGMIRWNDTTNDFEGYNGEDWMSLTKGPKQWGIKELTSVYENNKIIGLDSGVGDYFGNSVSISGEYAVVGAPYYGIGINENQGAAYVYKRIGTSWIEQVKILSSDYGVSDSFGNSVSISGDYIVVGAPFHDIGTNGNQGAAYVYKRNGTSWTHQAKLIGSGGKAHDIFGISVSIVGDNIVVGASGHDTPSHVNQGAVYAYKRVGSSWLHQAKLVATDGGTDDYFGNSVSVSGDYIVVGAPFHDSGLNMDQGAAYVFKRTFSPFPQPEYFWLQRRKILGSNSGVSDSFGTSVSISGDYIVVGAPNHGIEFNNYPGAAYVFKINDLPLNLEVVEQAKLLVSDSGTLDSFGTSVNISGDFLVVGAPNYDFGPNGNQGAAYVYKRDGVLWSHRVKLFSSDSRIGDSFGIKVSISGDHVIVGANLHDVGSESNQGAAYLYSNAN